MSGTTENSARRPRVAIVFGGRSSEHSISCVSAGSVLAAIDRDRWDVLALGITRDGRWTVVSTDPRDWAIVDGRLPEVDSGGEPVHLPADPTSHGLLEHEATVGAERPDRIDVVFPLLHGPFGEDGTIQGLLQLADVPYVGSGVLASAAAMDKAVMKVLLAGAGLPVGPYLTLDAAAWERDPDACLARIVDELKFPVFVKPARAGSSVGITKVTDPDCLATAIDVARVHDPKVVVEEGITGREIECGVIASGAGEPPRASLPAEIRVHPDHEFYDFEAKYVDGADLDVPADLPPAVTASVQELASRAFVALGCEGLARVDFFLTPDGDLVVNEVNTMPGFTPTSMFPRMWAATGLDYAALVDTLVRAALERRTGLR